MWDRRACLALASALFAASAFILALKLLQPASINVYLGTGENSTLVTKIPGFYTQTDLAVVLIFSVILGASGTFILLSRPGGAGGLSRPAELSEPLWKQTLEERRRKWEEISRTLKDDERKVYEAILEAGGVINQSELPEKTGLSKTSVSRALDLLERRELVERRRRGMGNVILLK